MATDGFLYSVPSDTNPNDGRLRDPTSLGIISGIGVLVSDSSSVSGAGKSISTGTGALAAQSSAVSGTGTVSSPLSITGSGVLLAQSSQVSGIGIGLSTGTGALASTAATLIGAGLGASSGGGALASQNASASGVGLAQWVVRSEPYLQEDGVSQYLLEDGAGVYLREEARILSGDAQISGEGIVSGEGYRFAPYVAPPRKARRPTLKIPESLPELIALTVSAPIQLAEPITYALEIDTLSEAGRSVERVLDNLEELRTLVHKEAKRRKRRKRMLALITIQ